MKSESDARVMARYKDLIDRGRKQFAEELDSIMPDVKLGNKGKTLISCSHAQDLLRNLIMLIWM